MKNLNYLSVCLIALCLGITSCDDESAPVKGCMDSLSINYNPDAVEDDGSCMYEGAVTFWMTEHASNFFVGFGIHQLNIYFDEVLVGSMPTSIYSDSEPECDSEDAYQLRLNLGSDTTKTYRYKFQNEDGQDFWEGTLTINHTEECAIEFLKFSR